MDTLTSTAIRMGNALLRQLVSHKLSAAEADTTRAFIVETVRSDDTEMLDFISRFSVIRCDIPAMAAIVQSMRNAGYGDQVPHLTLDHVLTYYDLESAAAQYGRNLSPSGTPAPAEETRKRAADLLVLIHHNPNLVSTVMVLVRQLGTVEPERLRVSINTMRTSSPILQESLS